MGLSNYQLVLLDNLIYLLSFKDYVDQIKDDEGNIDEEKGTIGKAIQYIIEKQEGLSTCFMSK